MDNSPALPSNYTGPLASFPLERMGPSNASYRGWRERSHVPDNRMSCVEYTVSGTDSDPDFPYVDGVPTLREAIAIARQYPGIYHDGAATHVVRRATRRVEGDPTVKGTGHTHRWRVFPDGKLELLIAYRTNRRNGTAVGLSDWVTKIEHPATFRRDRDVFRGGKPVVYGKPLVTELTDLSAIARQLGYAKAIDAIRPLIVEAHQEAFPRRTWPGSSEPAAEKNASDIAPTPQAHHGLLARAAAWARNMVA